MYMYFCICREVRPMPRNVQTQQEFLSDLYKMDHPRRGKAIVINNKQFKSHLQLPDRNGTDQDASALSCRFAELDFDVDLKNDQTAKQMMNLMKQGLCKYYHLIFNRKNKLLLIFEFILITMSAFRIMKIFV